MHVLFLTHYFKPEVNAPANRTHEHARRWVEDGHRVTVITGVPNHPKGELFEGYENRWFQRETIDGIEVVRTWMYLTSNEGFVRRTANYVLFAITAVLASLRCDRPDVVVATSPQFFCGLAGAVVAKLKRRPFVLEVRDLWPDSIVQLGQMERGALVRALEALETWLYKSAAGIVVNTRAFIDHIALRGIPRERIDLVYNGIDPELFRPKPRDRELLAEHGLEDKTIVSYIGTLGLAHGLMTLVEAADRSRDDDSLAFLLIGDGADRDRLREESERRGLTNLHWLGLRPREEIPTWIASSDLLLVMLRDLPVFQTVIPSKLFEYWAQERTVVFAAPQGECRALLEKEGAGISIDAENTDALLEAIAWARANPDEARSLAESGRRVVLRDFVRDELARRMAGFLERVAQDGARR